MVTSLTTRQIDNQNRELPFVVELVGLAGSGKTSLLHSLVEQNQQIQPLYPPDPRDKGYWSFFVWNSLLISPFLVHTSLPRPLVRYISRREIAWIAILNGWSGLINQTKQKQQKVFMLDQGPIFMLTEYRLFGPKTIEDEWTKRWWTRVIEKWAAIINVVVMLDAPNEELSSRVNSRSKWHLMKHSPQRDMDDFFEGYRCEFREVLTKFRSGSNKPELIYFNTGKASIKEINNELISRFGLATGNLSS